MGKLALESTSCLLNDNKILTETSLTNEAGLAKQGRASIQRQPAGRRGVSCGAGMASTQAFQENSKRLGEAARSRNGRLGSGGVCCVVVLAWPATD